MLHVHFKKAALGVFVAVLVVAAVGAFFAFGGLKLPPLTSKLPSEQAPNSFEECAGAGYPIMESYPPRCNVPGDGTFTQDIGNELEKMDLIVLERLRPNETVSSPLVISGRARGYWFFEASFPVELLDDSGSVIASGIATAQDEWMTEAFVPFSATLEFSSPVTEKGTLILKKDNPSGLPEHDDRLVVPVRFR